MKRQGHVVNLSPGQHRAVSAQAQGLPTPVGWQFRLPPPAELDRDLTPSHKEISFGIFLKKNCICIHDISEL